MKKQFFLYTLLGVIFFIQPLNSIENRLEYYEEGIDDFKDKDYQDAIENFKRFLKEQPYMYEVRDALFYLGKSYMKAKNYLEAVSQFNTLANKYPGSKYRKTVLFKKGKCYYKLKITTKAVRYLTNYINKTQVSNVEAKYHVEANIYIGLILKNRKNYKKSIKHLQKALYLHKKLSIKQKNLVPDSVQKPSQEEKKLIEKTYYELGVIYAKHFRKKKIALYYLNKYIKSKKDIPKSIKFILRGLSIFHLSMRDGLPDKAISDIKVDGDDVWVSTWGHGLVRFSRSSEKFVPIPLPSSQVRNMYIDFDKVYICTFDGIFIYNKKSGRITPIKVNNQRFTLAQKVIKDDRYIYFTTLSSGVVRYDTIKNKTAILGISSFLKSNQIYSITANHRYLIFGTIDSGLIIYNKKSKKATYLTEKHLEGDNIKSVLIDGRFLWIGVHKYGIFKYDMQNKKVYKMNWNIVYPSVVTKREHEIWIGSSGDGIRIYDQTKDKLEKLRAIEGLSSNEIHLIEVENDYIWIGYLDSGIDLLYRPLSN